MQKNSFVVLGLSESATQEDVRYAYETLKRKYTQESLLDGEEGYNASKKLTEIERAYDECIDIINGRISYEDNYSAVYSQIDQYIVDGKLDEAQSALDSVSTREAEWHYLQARVYFLRTWYVECKKQLELAIVLDDTNQKYRNTLNKLNTIMNPQEGASQQRSDATQGNAQGRAGYDRPTRSGQSTAGANSCCDACSCLICTDCCCECMGGDCIPCC